jgi:site-specific DNA-adenine methylase
MTYPGGKSGAGVYQTIISQIPPHTVYIEPFSGSAAIARFKAPAARTILIDLDPEALANLTGEVLPDWTLIQGDGLEYLRKRRWEGNEFVYCDPPYLLETRSTKKAIYRHEFCTQAQHLEMLTLLQAIPAKIMISGYRSALYDDILRKWRVITYRSMTRGGTVATEYLWMNYSEPMMLHDYRYLGKNFRERERIKRKQTRWKRRLVMMNALERAAMLSAMVDAGILPRSIFDHGDAGARRDPIVI